AGAWGGWGRGGGACGGGGGVGGRGGRGAGRRRHADRPPGLAVGGRPRGWLAVVRPYRDEAVRGRRDREHLARSGREVHVVGTGPAGQVAGPPDVGDAVAARRDQLADDDVPGRARGRRDGGDAGQVLGDVAARHPP